MVLYRPLALHLRCRVTDEVMARHLAATRRVERLSTHIRRGNLLRRSWNTAVDNVPGWPRTRVATPHDRPPIDRPTTRLGQLVSLAPGAFHPSLLEDLQRYRDNDGLLFSKLPEGGKACSYHERMQHHIFELTEALTGNRVLADGGHRLKKLTSGTAYGHCRVICATATALHMSGVADILSLRSIADVVTPRAASVLADAQRKRGGLGLLKYAYHCAFILRSIAKRCDLAFSPAEWGAWQALVRALSRYAPTRSGLCERNMRLLLQFDDQRKFEALLALPDVVLAELEKVRKAKRSPTMLEVLVAQTAVYIEILNALPIRVGSLVTLEIERNFSPSWRKNEGATLIIHPDPEKTMKRLEANLSPRTWQMISTFRRYYRPILPDATGSKFLFPSNSKLGHAHSNSASKSIRILTKNRLGIDINPHLWRHLMSSKLSEWTGRPEEGAKLLGHVHESRADTWYVRVDTKSASDRLRELTARLRPIGIERLRREMPRSTTRLRARKR